jgi:hypothetical protein
VVTDLETDITDQVNGLATAGGFSARGLVALLMAESDLCERARRPADPALDKTYWPDVSMGLGQQTVRYAGAYGLGDGTSDPGNIAEVEMALYVPETAVRIAADQYGRLYRVTSDHWEACAKYNGGPGATWKTIPIASQTNYVRAWGASIRYVVDGVPPKEEGMPEFVGGFAALAAELGEPVVGLPVEDEQHPDEIHSFQTTTTGLMWWASGGPPHFLASTRR